jgi:hypothetical protein
MTCDIELLASMPAVVALYQALFIDAHGLQDEFVNLSTIDFLS